MSCLTLGPKRGRFILLHLQWLFWSGLITISSYQTPRQNKYSEYMVNFDWDHFPYECYVSLMASFANPHFLLIISEAYSLPELLFSYFRILACRVSILFQNDRYGGCFVLARSFVRNIAPIIWTYAATPYPWRCPLCRRSGFLTPTNLPMASQINWWVLVGSATLLNLYLYKGTAA